MDATSLGLELLELSGSQHLGLSETKQELLKLSSLGLAADALKWISKEYGPHVTFWCSTARHTPHGNNCLMAMTHTFLPR